MNKYKNVVYILVGSVVLVGALVLLSPGRDTNHQMQQETALDASSALTTNEKLLFKKSVGENAPEFILESIDGETVTLSDYRGKVVLLNAWTTWCPPCKAEMPELETYFRTHRDDDFVLIGVNIGEKPEAVINPEVLTLK